MRRCPTSTPRHPPPTTWSPGPVDVGTVPLGDDRWDGEVFTGGRGEFQGAGTSKGMELHVC